VGVQARLIALRHLVPGTPGLRAGLGQSSFQGNWKELWRTQPDNVFLVKISYWFSQQ